MHQRAQRAAPLHLERAPIIEMFNKNSIAVIMAPVMYVS